MKKEKKLKLNLVSVDSTGEIQVLINGVLYAYYIDTAFYPKIEHFININANSKALSLLKAKARHYERLHKNTFEKRAAETLDKT